MLLDFSQAFDKVIHHHISDKLSYYGISNNTHGWINSLLSQCKQSVLAKCTHSSWATTTSGVLQDSSRIRPGLLLHRVSSTILPGFFLGYYYIGRPPGFFQDFSWATTKSSARQDSSWNFPGLLLHRVSSRIILFINDIKDQIQSTITLFADDSIFYRTINNCAGDLTKLFKNP